MNTRQLLRGAASLADAFLGVPSYAEELPRYGVFVYSSVDIGSDDPGGHRALIIRDDKGDSLYWYWSDGPVQASPLLIHDKTAAISFSVDVGLHMFRHSAARGGAFASVVEKYSGTISDDAITLFQDGHGGKIRRLRRVRDFSADAN